MMVLLWIIIGYIGALLCWVGAWNISKIGDIGINPKYQDNWSIYPTPAILTFCLPGIIGGPITLFAGTIFLILSSIALAVAYIADKKDSDWWHTPIDKLVKK